MFPQQIFIAANADIVCWFTCWLSWQCHFFYAYNYIISAKLIFIQCYYKKKIIKHNSFRRLKFFSMNYLYAHDVEFFIWVIIFLPVDVIHKYIPSNIPLDDPVSICGRKNSFLAYSISLEVVIIPSDQKNNFFGCKKKHCIVLRILLLWR